MELSTFESVKGFVDKFEREGDGQLDIVVLNAAMATLDFDLTEDGYETTCVIEIFASSTDIV